MRFLKSALMQRFPSLEAIREASEEELAKTPSMNARSAKAVYQYFHNDSSARVHHIDEDADL